MRRDSAALRAFQYQFWYLKRAEYLTHPVSCQHIWGGPHNLPGISRLFVDPPSSKNAQLRSISTEVPADGGEGRDKSCSLHLVYDRYLGELRSFLLLLSRWCGIADPLLLLGSIDQGTDVNWLTLLVVVFFIVFFKLHIAHIA